MSLTRARYVIHITYDLRLRRQAHAAISDDRMPKGFPADLTKAARRELWMLATAKRPEDLRVPPANWLESLSGDRWGSIVSGSIGGRTGRCLVSPWDDLDAKAPTGRIFQDLVLRLVRDDADRFAWRGMRVQAGIQKRR